MALASPFQKVPGTFKFGDYTYEWKSLLETPCYGFNGPNACYSSTCKHDGSTAKKQQPKMQQFIKQKSLSSSNAASTTTSKFSVKFNVRTIPGSVCDSDSISNSSSSSSSGGNGDERIVYSNTYNDSPNIHGAHFRFDNRSIKGQSVQQFFTVSPTIEVNFHVESPNTVHYSSFSTTNGYISSDGSSSCDNTSSINNSKNYAFNPLSKPFQPMKKNNRVVAGPLDVVSCATAAPVPAPTPTSKNENPPKTDSTAAVAAVDSDTITTFSKIICPPSKYVCILCPKTFSTATELQQHIENKAKQPNDCVICGLTFTHGYQLQRHLWIHLKNHRRIRSFNCRACHKKFRSLNQLHKHYELCQYKLYIFF